MLHVLDSKAVTQAEDLSDLTVPNSESLDYIYTKSEGQQSVPVFVAPVDMQKSAAMLRSERPRKRAKESAASRRARRMRADARVFTRSVRAAQAAAIHHTQPSSLVTFLREYIQ